MMDIDSLFSHSQLKIHCPIPISRRKLMAKLPLTPLVQNQSVQSPTSPARDTAVAAVKRCCKAWKRAYDAKIAAKGYEFEAKEAASEAYRAAMPTLSGEQNIRDFIACAAHGVLIEAIEGKQGTQLLYAAQVASGALGRIRNVAAQNARTAA